MIGWLKRVLGGEKDPPADRSGCWRRVRDAVVAAHPWCLACGSEENLEGHHIVPYHVRPDLECNEQNVIVLCRGCHLSVGHRGRWSRVVKTAVYDALAKRKPPQA